MIKDVEFPYLSYKRQAAVSQENRITPRDLFASGTLPGNTTIRIGDNIQIDGANRRIIVSDGTTDRVLIGYDEGGF